MMRFSMDTWCGPSVGKLEHGPENQLSILYLESGYLLRLLV